MLKEERHQAILDRLHEQKKVLTQPLSQHLAVSEDTIRRDLKELADQGLVKKVHGGAVLQELNPLPFQDRAIYAQEEKIQLAKLAISTLKPNQVILMDGGTTNVELARLIPKELPLTIFTNSLPVAAELTDRSRIRLQFIGGRILPQARVTVGPEAISLIERLRAELCILGTRSLDVELGLTEIDWDETLVKRAMINAAEEVMCLVISEKLGTTQPYLIGKPDQISTLVTNLPYSDPQLQAFRQHQIDCLCLPSTNKTT